MKKTLLLLLIPFIGIISKAQPDKNKVLPEIQNSIIWTPFEIVTNGGYAVFRKSFDLEKTGGEAQLELFADSRYLLWINGQYVMRGPCRFNPKRPEYNEIDVHHYLKKGNNVIVFLVHDYGDFLNGHIMKHVPGLAAILKISGEEFLRSDSTWRCSDKTMYQPAPESWNTIPDLMDARLDNGTWMKNDFDDSEWQKAKQVEGNLWGKMYRSELPLPQETKLKNIKLLPSNELLSAKLPLELIAGQEILIDYGTMAMAYTSIDLEAEAASSLTMKYALRYKNGNPVEMYGKGNTYTTRAGRQFFMTTDQWGSHYMKIKCDTGKVKIYDIQITDRRYPFERLGKFTCSNEVLTKLWEMAVKTIEVTTDDGYGSDARERNEWIQDASKASYQTSRVALAGPEKDGKPVFSDPGLLKNMLRHAAQSQLPDGRLLATFPTDRGPEDCHYVIEDYSCQWFEALNMYYDATADKEFVREMWPTAVAQLKWFLDRRSPRGLLLAREYSSFDNPFAYITCEGATINAYFYGALKVAQSLALLLDESQTATFYQRAAEDLKVSFNQQFWNESEKAYNSAFLKDKIYTPTVHAQLIALNYGLTTTERESDVRKWFLANYKNPGDVHLCSNNDYEKMVEMKAGINMPIMYYWVFSELYRTNTEELDKEAIGEMLRRWTPMVIYQQDAGTLSESFTNKIGEGANESCHNYGSVPAYFLSSYVLGVRRVGNVSEKHLLIEPRLGNLTFAKGVVVTEFGPVPISWKKSDNGKVLDFEIKLPDGIIADLHLPKLKGKSTLVLNKKILMKNEKSAKGVNEDGRWIIVKDIFGKCSGSITSNKNNN
jgi:hypothetical protein